MALRKRKMNSRRDKTPTVSVSKKPREDLWMTEGIRARMSAESNPTVFPAMSLPMK